MLEDCWNFCIASLTGDTSSSFLSDVIDFFTGGSSIPTDAAHYFC